MSKTIRIEEETHAALEALKGENETFDDVISRLVAERRERIEADAGIWKFGPDFRPGRVVRRAEPRPTSRPFYRRSDAR